MVENEPFAHEMEEMYLQDLKNATEIVLDMKHRVIAPWGAAPLQSGFHKAAEEARDALQPERFASATRSAQLSLTVASWNPSKLAS